MEVKPGLALPGELEITDIEEIDIILTIIAVSIASLVVVVKPVVLTRVDDDISGLTTNQSARA